MKIILLGAEVPSNRVLLESTSARHVGVSYWRLMKRGLPKSKDYLLENYFDDHFYIYVYPGIPKDVQLTTEELESFAADYETFIANNIDRLDTFNEITGVDPDFVKTQRKTCWSEVPPGKFQPVWNPQSGISNLQEIADTYLDIGIPGEAIETYTNLAAVTRNLSRSGTRFHILGSAKPDNLRAVTADTTTTMSWLSPMMNGETIVWDGNRIVRYPKRMKEQARPRYRNIYLKAGLSPDRILEDDPQEVCRLAVWSYLQYEERINGMNDENLYDNSDDMDTEEYTEAVVPVIDKKPSEMRKLVEREPNEMGLLPVFGYDSKTVIDNENGVDVIREIPVIQSQSVSLRICDTCFVSSNCPAFKARSVCAFKLPVEVKTKDQLKALINSIIEMQGQRVAFMRFSEEINGGYADPNTSQEIDRLFKLIKTTKELDDSREFIRMTVERQGTSGVLSSIFGDRANVLKELPDNGLNEEQTTDIIRGFTEDK